MFKSLLFTISARTSTILRSSNASPNSIVFQNHLCRGFHASRFRMSELSQMSAKYDFIVWMDMEMSGLDISKDEILEVAVVITDSNLNTVAEGPDIVIHQSDHVLNGMNEWCTKNHLKTGLTDAVRRSKISLQEAQSQVLEFVKLHTPPSHCPLAGNSVYMDRLFLRKFMPLVDTHLHYRIIDVSSIKELCRRWCPDEYAKVPAKAFGHRALMDIRESIQELQYYRTAIFQKTNV